MPTIHQAAHAAAEFHKKHGGTKGTTSTKRQRFIRHLMSLRSKTIILFAIMFIIVLAVFMVIIYYRMPQMFIEFEETSLQSHVHKLLRSMKVDLESLYVNNNNNNKSLYTNYYSYICVYYINYYRHLLYLLPDRMTLLLLWTCTLKTNLKTS